MLERQAENRVWQFGGLAAGLLIAGFAVAGMLALAGFPAGIGALLTDRYTMAILRFTLLQSVLSTLLSIGLAIPVALALARQRNFAGRLWLLRLFAVPMGLPVLAGALGLLAIFGRNGVFNHLLGNVLGIDPISIYGLGGILLAHVFFNLPLAVRLFVAALDRLPPEVWRLSASLNMNSMAVFRLVAWPQLRAAIPGAAGLIFMLCLTSFTLVLTLGGGPAATTLEVAIFQALRFDFDPPRAVALSILQIGISALSLVALGFLPAIRDEGDTLSGRIARPDGRRLSARLFDGIVIGIAALFILAPIAALLVDGLRAAPLSLLAEPIFWRATVTSLALGLSAGLMATITVTLIVRGELALGQGWKARLVESSASLVLLVPPAILGTGWFLLLRPDEASPVLPLLVCLINSLMAAPFVHRILKPAWANHKRRTDRLSASLNLTGWVRIRTIDAPALLGPYLTGFSFAVALSLGDLGAVALFGSDRLLTLPWLIYSRLGSYRTDDAAALAMILMLMCLAITIAGALPNRRTAERTGE